MTNCKKAQNHLGPYVDGKLSEGIQATIEFHLAGCPVSNIMLRTNHSTHEADIKMDPPTSMTPGTIGDENHSKRRLDQLEGRFTSLFFDRHMVTIGAEGREEERKDDSGLANDITNLSFLDAENKDTGESLENRPDISAFVKLGYSNPDLGIRTSFRLTHIGEREFDAGNETAVTRADFRISKKLSRQMECFTGVDNIANAYVDDGLEPMSFYAGLTFCY